MSRSGCEYCDIANGAECPHSDEHRATNAQIIEFIIDRAADSWELLGKPYGDKSYTRVVDGFLE